MTRARVHNCIQRLAKLVNARGESECFRRQVSAATTSGHLIFEKMRKVNL